MFHTFPTFLGRRVSIGLKTVLGFRSKEEKPWIFLFYKKIEPIYQKYKANENTSKRKAKTKQKPNNQQKSDKNRMQKANGPACDITSLW